VKPPLPDALPENPLPLVDRWIAEASESLANATAMALATVEPDGRPSARMVICRGFDVESGWFAFYTDRESPKGAALAVHPRAALVFHWDAFGRQLRVEGPVTLAPDADSDAYWDSRPAEARIAATTSEQSRPIESRDDLLDRFRAATRRFDPAAIPRPARWGGYRVWAERIELWVSQPARLHDRALWTRPLMREGERYGAGPWRATRLQP
jgi:pyridoxamine 5'-phosphate oxidase